MRHAPSRFARGRFIPLLVAFVVLLLVYPFFDTAVLGRALLDFVFTLVLLGALYSVTPNRLAFRFASALTLAALGGRWLPYVVGGGVSLSVRYGAGAFALALAAGVILLQTMRSKRITFEQIAGALSVYLLIGLVWAHAYFFLETMTPGSLALGIPSHGTEQTRFGACVYFSYVTLTTLGYGDIAPVSGTARSLAMVEAVVGQFYLAVLIGRLVGIQVARHGHT